MWCLYVYFFTGRIAAKRQTAGIKSAHSHKISIFASQRRLVPIHVKFGLAEGTVGLFGRAKFRANRSTGVGMRLPKVQKFPLFDK